MSNKTLAQISRLARKDSQRRILSRALPVSSQPSNLTPCSHFQAPKIIFTTNILTRHYSTTDTTTKSPEERKKQLAARIKQDPKNPTNYIDLARNYLDLNQELYALYSANCGLMLLHGKEVAGEQLTPPQAKEMATLNYLGGIALKRLKLYGEALKYLHAAHQMGYSEARKDVQELSAMSEEQLGNVAHIELPERRSKMDRSVASNKEYFNYLSSVQPECKVEIRDTAEKGRGVFAVEPIQKGETFYREFTSFMVNSAQFANELCSTCGDDLPEKPIAPQQDVKFCSEKCRDRAEVWQKSIKGKTSNTVKRLLSNDTTSVANIPLLMERIAGYTLGHERYPISSDELPPFVMLASNMDTDYNGNFLKNLEHKRLHVSFMQYLIGLHGIQTDLKLQFNPYFDMEWMLNMHSIIFTNCFTTEVRSRKHTASSPKEKNLALFPGLASYFNHSCESNAQWEGAGNLLLVTATRDIAANEEVFIDYIPSVNSPQSTWMQRQQALLPYNFECTCPKCTAQRPQGQ